MRATRLSGLALAALAALAVVLGGACAEPTFSSHRRDNNPLDLSLAMQRRGAVKPGPQNATGHALAFLVTPAPARLITYDLTDGKVLWSVETDITSRVAVGKDLVFHRVGERRIVARDVRTGREAYGYEMPAGTNLLGVSADDRGAYLVSYTDEGARRVSTLRALRGGSIAWVKEVAGRIAVPAAAGGLVYVPFLSQYLAILDADNGQEIARLRPGREMITFVRTLPEGVFFGDQGVYMLNARAVEGRKGAAFQQAKLPEIVRTFYYWDGYNAAQTRYSAFDRNRLLWRGEPAGEGFGFRGGIVLSSYRFLFSFDGEAGALRWAHSNPKSDITASEHLGSAVAFVAADGEITVLDVRTGTRLWAGKVGAPVIGATFDADGFAPQGAPSAAPAEPLAAALRRIVWDPDRRFVAIKVFAVDALAQLPGADVSRELLKLVRKDRIPREIYARAGDALVARKDRQILPELLDALKVRYDYVEASKPRGLEIVARALAALDTSEGMSLLIDHLMDPETALVAVREIAVAATRAKARVAIPPMRDFLTTYRADPTFATDPGPMIAVVEGLLQIGGSKERQLLRFVADDPRTIEKLRSYINAALDQTRPGGAPPAGAPSAGEKAAAEAGGGGVVPARTRGIELDSARAKPAPAPRPATPGPVPAKPAR
ncbi:MAG TPA: PQQ-binding-like beta-propeller repeat protein [Polyangia bacterium]